MAEPSHRHRCWLVGEAMKLSGRTALVTGAASGIGRAMAERFAAVGMKVVLADIEEPRLREVERELTGAGATVAAVLCDVSSRAAVEQLADAAEATFGNVHLLCNNAGVSGGGYPIWSTTDNDWTWVMGVNVMGVVHGLQVFVPRMLASGDECHVVNTSSVSGLSTGPHSIYGVAKHAVTRLSEIAWYDLRATGAPIGISVLCPCIVATHIVTAERNRPAHLRDELDSTIAERRRTAMLAGEERFLREGMRPAEVADAVVEAVQAGRFWIFVPPDLVKAEVDRRMRTIFDEADPPPAWDNLWRRSERRASESQPGDQAGRGAADIARSSAQ
jgi:NAD(P)-dependent dehydrogenase (short-subunit alcohol dehydrogenase family)